MKIRLQKRFVKQYKKLPKKKAQKVDQVLELFQKDPKHPDLKNHPLKGGMKGKRAMVIEFDLRIVFEEFDDYTMVYMLSIGSHDKVYK